MDMRLPPGIGTAAGNAERPPLLLLQRWQPVQPMHTTTSPTVPTSLRLLWQRLIGR